MRLLLLAILMFVWAPAWAKNVSSQVTDQKQDIHVLGKLNVNTASREALLTVPGVDAGLADAILDARQKAPIDDLQTVGHPIPTEAAPFLKTDGTSDYRRIRRLPLQVIDHVRTATR